MRCRRRSLLAWLVIGIVAVVLPGLALWLPRTASGQGAVMKVVAPSSWPVDGGDFNVTIEIEGVQNLGAYEWQLSFDPALLQFKTATNGPFLGSTGRPTACELIQPPGKPPDIVMPPGNVRLGCGTPGGPTPLGASGSGLLSTLTFSPVAQGNATLSFTRAEMANPMGDDIPVTAIGGCIAIAAPGSTAPACATPTPRPPATTTPAGPTPGGPTATATPTGPLPTLTPVPPGLEAVDLAAGCNAVASTYPDGTPIGTIASNVGRTGILTSVWKFDLGTWLGYSPQYPEVSDLTVIDFLDAIFICVNSPGAFVRPIV